MDIKGTALVVLFGVFLCNADAGRVRRGDWNLKVDPAYENGNPSVTGSLGYKKDGFSASGHYTETFGRGQDSWGGSVGYNKGGLTSGVDYSGTRGYNRYDGHIGYQKGNFHVKGTGFRDSTRNWGVGVSGGWRWKRSLPTPMGTFHLRVEADSCQFIVYDRNLDGKVTNEEVREVFSNEVLANGLFMELDIDGDGVITEEEFETAKTNVIFGCYGPDDE